MASRRNAKAFDDAPRAKLDKATLRKAMRVFRYLRPYRAWFSIGLVLLIITTGLSLLFPLLLGQLVDAARGDVGAHRRLGRTAAWLSGLAFQPIRSSRRAAVIRSTRALATRDRMVPSGHPHTSAASAYDSPSTWVSISASRRS